MGAKKGWQEIREREMRTGRREERELDEGVERVGDPSVGEK